MVFDSWKNMMVFDSQEPCFAIRTHYPFMAGDHPLFFNFYVSKKALPFIAKEGVTKEDEILASFVGKGFKRLRDLCKRGVEGAFSPYKHMQNPLEGIYDINVIVTEGEFDAFVILEEDGKSIRMGITNDSLGMRFDKVIEIINHELYHILAERHEGQEKLREQIEEEGHRLKEGIDKVQSDVEQSIAYAIKFMDSKGYTNAQQVAHYFRKLVGRFLNNHTLLFRNKLEDCGLCVIAIAKKDLPYVNFATIADSDGQNEFQRRIAILKSHVDAFSRIKDEEHEAAVKAIKMMQFMVCYDHLPYVGVPCAFTRETLDRKPLELQTLRDFKSTVKRYCDPLVASLFLEFFEAMLGAMIAQTQYLEKNSTLEAVHNSISNAKGREAFSLLHRNFGILLKEIRQ